MKTKKSAVVEVAPVWYYIMSMKVKRTVHYMLRARKVEGKWKFMTTTDRELAEHLTLGLLSNAKKAVTELKPDWKFTVQKLRLRAKERRGLLWSQRELYGDME